METRDEISVLVWARTPECASRLAFWLSGLGLPHAVFSHLAALEVLDPEEWSCLLVESGEGIEETVGLRLRLRWNWQRIPIVMLQPLGSDPHVSPPLRPSGFGMPLAPSSASMRALNAAPRTSDMAPICLTCPDHPAALKDALTQIVNERRALQPDPASALRNSFRQFCNGPAFAEFEVKVVDISEEGAQLETPFKTPPGARFMLNLKVLNPEMTHALTFKTLGVRQCLPPKTGCRLHGKFEQMTPELQRLLRRTIMKIQMNQARRTTMVTQLSVGAGD